MQLGWERKRQESTVLTNGNYPRWLLAASKPFLMIVPLRVSISLEPSLGCEPSRWHVHEFRF